MSERKGLGEAEAALDRQLNDLPTPGPSTSEVPLNDQPPSAGSPDGHDDQNARLISISQLRVEVFHSLQSGMTLAENIYDESGVLLLASGSRITARFLQLLRERGINRVRLGSAQPLHTIITDEDAKEARWMGAYTPVRAGPWMSGWPASFKSRLSFTQSRPGVDPGSISTISRAKPGAE